MTKRSKRHYEDWDGSSDGYEYNASRKRFRRNKIDGVVGGVCAGIGDYFNIDPVIVRVITVISFFMTGMITFWIYLGIWIFTPSDARAPYHREYRQARRAKRRRKSHPEEVVHPTASYRDVRSKFRSLESRLQGLEKSITSSEWQLRRKFRDLEN